MWLGGAFSPVTTFRLLLSWSTGSRAPGLSSGSSRAQQWRLPGSAVAAPRLWSTGSIVVVHGLSCSKACGILPDQESNRCPCTARWILCHRAAGAIPFSPFLMHFDLCVHTKSFQLCLALYNPMDCSLPGSSVHGILQTRVLEQAAMPSCREIFLNQGSNLHLLCLLLGRCVLYH